MAALNTSIRPGGRIISRPAMMQMTRVTTPMAEA